MNSKSPVLSAALGVACWAGLGAMHDAAAATAPPPVPQAASAASAAVGPQIRRERPLPSPAVRAAQGAATPGDLRPDNPIVPQIAVPLRRPRDAAGSDRAGSAAGTIDDAAARCRAATSDSERAACRRGGTVPTAAPQR